MERSQPLRFLSSATMGVLYVLWCLGSPVSQLQQIPLTYLDSCFSTPFRWCVRSLSQLTNWPNHKRMSVGKLRYPDRSSKRRSQEYWRLFFVYPNSSIYLRSGFTSSLGLCCHGTLQLNRQSNVFAEKKKGRTWMTSMWSLAIFLRHPTNELWSSSVRLTVWNIFPLLFVVPILCISGPIPWFIAAISLKPIFPRFVCALADNVKMSNFDCIGERLGE